MLILTPASFSLANPGGPAALVDWARTANGQQLLDQGSSPLSALPADDEVVLVLPPQAISWHKITWPKVPVSRQRTVLDGLLEERVLDDTTDLHFALSPGARAGQAVWVAACHKTWVKNWIQTLDNVGRPVTRMVPGLSPLGSDPSVEWPSGISAVHWAHHQGEQAWLASGHIDGVYLMPLRPSSAAALAALLPGNPSESKWLVEPAATAQAEECFDRRFELQTVATWLLRNAQSGWNLAQFDLSLSGSARRGQRLKQTLREWRSAPAWRPARWGLAALVAVQLIGVNALAWQERRQLQAKKTAINEQLKSTFPRVKLVLDAPVQMRRELNNLRQTSGQLSTSDLEAMLGGLAQANAAQAMDVRAVQFQIDGPNNQGQAQFTNAGNVQANWASVQSALLRAGWEASLEENQITLRPKKP